MDAQRLFKSTPRASARVKIEKKLAFGGFARQNSALTEAHRKQGRRKHWSKRVRTLLARLRAWFFPQSDEVIGEIAATGCRNQPGEKIENRIAGKPMPAVAKQNYYGNDTQATAPKKWIRRPMLSS